MSVFRSVFKVMLLGICLSLFPLLGQKPIYVVQDKNGNFSVRGNAGVGSLSIAQYVIVPAVGKTTLPAASVSNSGRIAIVIDGTDGSDCVTGGGTSVALCWSTGLVWESIGGAGGGSSIPGLASDGDNGITVTNKVTAQSYETSSTDPTLIYFKQQTVEPATNALFASRPVQFYSRAGLLRFKVWSDASTGVEYTPATGVTPVNTGATANQFFTAYNSTTGAFTKARPSCADLSDAGTGCSGAAGSATFHPPTEKTWSTWGSAFSSTKTDASNAQLLVLDGTAGGGNYITAGRYFAVSAASDFSYKFRMAAVFNNSTAGGNIGVMVTDGTLAASCGFSSQGGWGYGAIAPTTGAWTTSAPGDGTMNVLTTPAMNNSMAATWFRVSWVASTTTFTCEMGPDEYNFITLLTTSALGFTPTGIGHFASLNYTNGPLYTFLSEVR